MSTSLILDGMAVLKDVINLTLLPVEGATNSGLIASHIVNEISTEVGKEFKIWRPKFHQ